MRTTKLGALVRSGARRLPAKRRSSSGSKRRAGAVAAGAGVAALAFAGASAAPAPPPHTLIWSDEFDGSRLDPDKWTLARDCWGGGNGERQCYTPRPQNAVVRGGFLHITARREPGRGPGGPDGRGPLVSREFTSGKVLTRGRASFRYGRIEVRARLPQGQGVWPAIWLLPEHDNYGPYPASGEIDLAEAVDLGTACVACEGGRETRVHGALHDGPTPEANREAKGWAALTDPGAFHVFAFDWTPQAMTWSVDGRAYFQAPSRPPFDQRFHLVLNLAVGGRWAESAGAGGVDPRAFPAEFLVDWVRVYD